MAEERVQRRLAAILATDVVGYSRLTENDEEGTLARLKQHRRELIEPMIAEHRGRTVKLMGDGALVEFMSAVDAVRCAVAIQDGMQKRNADTPADQRIEFRIGINLGDIVIDGDDILGNGVNVAARLEGLCGPGEVYVSGTVHDHVEGKLAAHFDDLGEQKVKNIAKPIRVYRARNVTGEETAQTSADAAPSLPDKPSIAVLPFANMSGDPEQAYFSDGITEDIITELSRFHTLFVIARNSSFLFRGESVDVMEVGHKLGVQYVVEGSVRKVANRVRITAQLVDAVTGHHLWADRYDREMGDIFAVQDEITQTIVSTLPGRLEVAGRERAKRKLTANMTAYDFVLLGIDRWIRLSPDENAKARQFFQKAIDLDPQYARAHARLAFTHISDVFLEYSTDQSLDEAFKHVQTALALDDEDSWCHGVFGQALFLRGKDAEAEIHFKRALVLNPNDAEVVAFYANVLVYLGRAEEGLAWITKAKRLNPFPPNLYHWYHAQVLYSLREYEQAVGTLQEIRLLNWWGHGFLAASYAQMGRLDEAHCEMKTFISARHQELRERGDPVPANALDLALARANRYRDPSDRKHFLDGLRKAGLTE